MESDARDLERRNVVFVAKQLDGRARELARACERAGAKVLEVRSAVAVSAALRSADVDAIVCALDAPECATIALLRDGAAASHVLVVAIPRAGTEPWPVAADLVVPFADGRAESAARVIALAIDRFARAARAVVPRAESAIGASRAARARMATSRERPAVRMPGASSGGGER